jgi:hypothetical protein
LALEEKNLLELLAYRKPGLRQPSDKTAKLFSSITNSFGARSKIAANKKKSPIFRSRFVTWLMRTSAMADIGIVNVNDNVAAKDDVKKQPLSKLNQTNKLEHAGQNYKIQIDQPYTFTVSNTHMHHFESLMIHVM